MSAQDHVSILAMGVCSPLAPSFAETARLYAEGERAFARERGLVGADGLPPTLSQAIPLSECRNYGERLARLFAAAAADCSAQCARAHEFIAPLRLVVPHRIASEPAAEDFRLALEERHADLFSRIELVPGGAAEALSELGQATRMVLSGEAPLAAVGALDSLIHPSLLDRMAADGLMLMKGLGSGIIPGEAAVLAIVGVPAAGQSTRGRMRSIYRAEETEKVTMPKGILGQGLAEAFRRGAEFAAPDRLLIDMDGERWRAEEFGFAVARTRQEGIVALAADPETPTLQLGSCGTASGLLLAALALADPPPSQANGALSMVSAASREGGARTVAFIERAARNQGRKAA